MYSGLSNHSNHFNFLKGANIRIDAFMLSFGNFFMYYCLLKIQYKIVYITFFSFLFFTYYWGSYVMGKKMYANFSVDISVLKSSKSKNVSFRSTSYVQCSAVQPHGLILINFCHLSILCLYHGTFFCF